MQHKVKLTVLDKKLYPELQREYCQDKEAGVCPCYEIGDEFIFSRYGEEDDFWHCGINTVVNRAKPAEGEEFIAGGTHYPHCAEAWDAFSRYIYTGLNGGAIMRNWMENPKVMITCCQDGTRPVIFKIERMDYYAVHVENLEENLSECEQACNFLIDADLARTFSVNKGFIEIYPNDDYSEYDDDFVDEILGAFSLSGLNITKID